MNNKITVGDIVLHEGAEWVTSHVASNYAIIKTEEQQKRVWLNEVSATGKTDSAMITTQQNKVKAARIIGMALGYTDADAKNDPTMIINTALRMIRNKPLNPEAKAILGRMMQMATSMEIHYDEKLVPKLSEGADVEAAGVQVSADYKVSPSGRKVPAHRKTDQDAEETNEETVCKVDTKKKSNIAGDIMSDEDKKKLQQRMESAAYDDTQPEDMDDVELFHSIDDDDIIEHGYDDDEFEIVSNKTNESVEFDMAPLTEVLSRIERMRAAVRIRRSEAKREFAEKVALKRPSSGTVLAKRARRIAVKTIEQRLARKPLNQLTVTEKERIERTIQAMKPVVTRLAMRLIPRVRQIEKTRLSR